ncbi:unnamed protein product [Paramecium sonneborni]|uniref:Uncharacterized protein n=1 Tax=Paramecium sonneborni TaxID=65129 RepID=A0A8S1RHT8_9CILI|nr:unnamed protein product [Paramecium sonneborni]
MKMNQTQQQLIRNQTPEDLIQSYLKKQRENDSTNSQMQTQIKVNHIQQHSIEQLKTNLTNRQTSNESIMKNDSQLVYQLFQLQQKVRNCEKQFIKKELHLQEQILQAQKNFEKTMNLMKLKYQMQIEDLNSELKMKDEEICSLNLQLQSNNLNKIGEQIFSSQQKQKSINSEYPNSQSSRKYCQFQMPTRSLNSSRKEGVSKYQKELNRIRIQTVEFAEKFENEKHLIESDIAILKNQKQILRSYLNYNKIESTDQSKYKPPIKLNNLVINRQNSSSFGVKEYFSRKQ